ncbi:DUF2523 domain-containing protein [Moraxella bovis]|uniref:DUF2523 domain-containing protein n=1 Tax=Moraxella bovis TaxID=476 RepID=UPI0022268ADC|nr:DUF2523 domain-containing protein [Moraxella bovis]UYZ91017.1 DUF2523 domain-containing protein [Moraxella bovis]UYZ91030.1 DUF2523 domain-containing protein [Moraxella bovis]
MGKLLSLVITWAVPHVIGAIIKYLFSGFIGIVSYNFVLILVNRYIQSAINSLSQVDSGIAMMINLAQFDVAISIIMGAISIKGSIIAMGLAIVKGDNQ